MIILRQHDYSSSDKKKNNNEKEDDNKDNKKESKLKKVINDPAIGGALGGAALLYSGPKLANMINEKSGQEFLRSIDKKRGLPLSDEDKEVTRKLLEKTKSLGIKVKHDDSFRNSAYVGASMSRHLKKYVDKLDESKKDDIYNSLARAYGMDKKNAREIGNDTIIYGIKGPAVLAHEMGHAAMSRKGRSKDLLGRAAHSTAGTLISLPSNLANNDNKKARLIGSAAFVGAGIRHGIKASKKEEAGDTKGAKREKLKGLIGSSLFVAPELIREAAASRKGLKYLKEAGASKETIKKSRKLLGQAFGTYAGKALKPVALDVAGTGLGYAGHKLVTRIKNKKESDKKNKKSEENKEN